MKTTNMFAWRTPTKLSASKSLGGRRLLLGFIEADNKLRRRNQSRTIGVAGAGCCKFRRRMLVVVVGGANNSHIFPSTVCYFRLNDQGTDDVAQLVGNKLLLDGRLLSDRVACSARDKSGQISGRQVACLAAWLPARLGSARLERDYP